MIHSPKLPRAIHTLSLKWWQKTKQQELFYLKGEEAKTQSFRNPSGWMWWGLLREDGQDHAESMVCQGKSRVFSISYGRSMKFHFGFLFPTSEIGEQISRQEDTAVKAPWLTF